MTALIFFVVIHVVITSYDRCAYHIILGPKTIQVVTDQTFYSDKDINVHHNICFQSRPRHDGSCTGPALPDDTVQTSLCNRIRGKAVGTHIVDTRNINISRSHSYMLYVGQLLQGVNNKITPDPHVIASRNNMRVMQPCRWFK